MNKLVLIAAILTLNLNVLAQEKKIRENPMNGMMAMDFFDVHHGYLAHYDSLFSTTDNGNSWSNRLQIPGQFSDIEAVSLHDVFATAMSYNGGISSRMLYRSGNAGVLWDSLFVGVNSSVFNKISVKSLNQVVLYGNAKDRFLLADFNATNTTHLIEAGGMIQFLKFVSIDTAFALITIQVDSVNYTGDIKLKRSVDGGLTWVNVWTNYGYTNRVGADFLNMNSGMVKMDSTIYSTQDQGQSWNAISLPVSTAWGWGSNEIQMGQNGAGYFMHEDKWMKVKHNSNPVDITPDNISYIHPLCFVKVFNDDNWFIAENILSCGIYGANLWRKSELEEPLNLPIIKNSSNFKIFPNPARDILNVQSQLEGQTEVTLFDMVGKKVKKGILENGQFDISDLKPNAYLLQLKQKKEMHTQKIILE